MNLPPDKARLLRQYDNEKKWDLICDQVRSEKFCFLHTPVNTHLHVLSERQHNKDSVLCVVRPPGEVSGEESASHLHPEAARILGPQGHAEGG